MLRESYAAIRKKLPKKYQSQLSKMVFDLPWKPKVKKDHLEPGKKFPGGEKGGLVISADFEMSWAFRYSKKTVDYLKMGKIERENFPVILPLLEQLSIPITWATVGHLFLSKCTRGEHDWMERLPHFDDHWKFVDGDWFDHDPCGDYTHNPEWYAPDLIEQILHSKVPHEIGCHTFSHIDCSYKNCPPQVLDDELKACSEAAQRFGLTMESLVFPGGTAGNYQILAKHGIKIYRKNIEIKLAYPFLDQYGILVSPTTSSFGDNGLGWDKDYFIYRYKKLIDKAIKTNTVAHFWFHPSIDAFSLNHVFPEVLKYASQKRDEGSLWIGTMSSIAKHIENSKDLIIP